MVKLTSSLLTEHTHSIPGVYISVADPGLFEHPDPQNIAKYHQKMIPNYILWQYFIFLYNMILE